MQRAIEFWFDFASTYSFLSAMRIETLAKEKGVNITWHPFLLGPIFQAQGWTSSPFAHYPNKGLNMWRDIERQSEKYGLNFKRPAQDQISQFPRHSVLAARIALTGLHNDWVAEFIKAVFTAEFSDGLDIGRKDVLRDILQNLKLDPASVLQQANSVEIRAQLRANVEAAMAHKIFGAPSFIIRDELFWGNDRLEDALDWACCKVFSRD